MLSDQLCRDAGTRQAAAQAKGWQQVVVEHRLAGEGCAAMYREAERVFSPVPHLAQLAPQTTSKPSSLQPPARPQCPTWKSRAYSPSRILYSCASNLTSRSMEPTAEQGAKG